MTEMNKTLSNAEKIKALAMGLIGSLFFTWGLTYFKEQDDYRVPRILLPVFELFGNIGLAFGLLLLGGLLMFFAYRKFIKFGGKPIVMQILLPLLVVVSFMASKLTENSDKGKTQIERMESLKEKINNQTERKLERPKMVNQKANEFLDKRENLLVEMKKAKNTGDETTFQAIEKQFWALNKDFVKITIELKEDENYHNFISYSDQITNEVNKLRKN